MAKGGLAFVRDTFADQCRRLALAILCGTFLLSPASASMPDRSWIGVKRLAVLTDFRSGLVVTTLGDDFCATVKRIAERGAPVPVECVEAGSPALQADGTVVLVAQAAVQELGGSQVLVLTARKDRDGGLGSQPMFFGAAPRAVTLTGSAADSAAMEQALAASLSEVLSWLRPDDVQNLTPGLSPKKRERFNG